MLGRPLKTNTYAPAAVKRWERSSAQMKFLPIDKTNLSQLSPYFAAQPHRIGDFSLAFQFMWYDALKPMYAVIENCLVIREIYAGKCYFHYPLSRTGDREEELRAVERIEEDCRSEYVRLHFTNVPESRMPAMVARYGEALVTNNRRWRDYLYYAEDFRTFGGKKHAGQRNHVKKFAALYPDWTFSELSPSDMGALDEFLRAYEGVQHAKKDYIAEEEMEEVYEILPHMKEFGMFAGVLRTGGRIVGFSAGEKCGDTVIVHIEKALRGYEGVYPFLAQQFARTFCGEGVTYLNRMDDAGDLGLRKSKLQYGPCAILAKYNIIPKRAIDLLSRPPRIETERLVLMPVRDEDAEDYARLVTDAERNRYWGEAWGMPKSRGNRSDMFYVRLARKAFARRWEMPLAIYVGGMFAGEVLLHSFGYAAEAEIGVRLLPSFEGMGYASEAVRALTEYAFSKMNLERVEARCFRENTRSRAMLLASGMRETGCDDTYFFFLRTPVM